MKRGGREGEDEKEKRPSGKIFISYASSGITTFQRAWYESHVEAERRKTGEKKEEKKKIRFMLGTWKLCWTCRSIDFVRLRVANVAEAVKIIDV